MRKTLSILLCLVMLCSLVSVASAAPEFPDMPEKDHWSYAALQAAVDNGLLRGTEDGRLDPKGTLTRAQMAAIVNRAFGAEDTADLGGFRDIQAGAWYVPELAKALRMGTFRGNGSGLMEPDAPITREQAFTVIARAFLLEDGDETMLEKFPDADEISGYARGPLAALVEGGYIQGTQAGLEPKANISREAFAQVFFNLLKTYVSSSGEYSADAEGNVMVNVPGVTLKDMKIRGDLLLGEGVGSGEVVLDGTEVTGRLVIRGGGDHSIILKNNSTVGSARIGKTGDGGVRLRTEEGCRIEAVYIDDGSDVIILDGEFNQIVIDTDAPVILEDVQAVGLTVKAEGADVRLRGETEVSAVLVAEKAEGATLSVDESAKVAALESQAESVVVSGEGKVDVAQVSGGNTQVNTAGTSLTVEEGAQGVSQNGQAVEAGETVLTKQLEEETASSGGDTGSGSGVDDPDDDSGDSPPEPEETLYTVVLSEEEGGAHLSFSTLEEAMAEAEKHLYRDEDEGEIWEFYPRIELTGADSLENLNLPAGHSLRVLGTLTLSGNNSSLAEAAALGDGRFRTPAKLIVQAPEGALYLNDGSYGFSRDCAVQLIGDAPEDPEGVRGLRFEGGNGVTSFGTDIRVNRSDVLALAILGPIDQEAFGNTYTLTVPSGVSLELIDSYISMNIAVEAGASLRFTDSFLDAGGSLESSGSVILDGNSSLNGSVRFLGGTVENLGDLNLSGAVLTLEAGATFNNRSIIFCEDTSVTVAGTLNNDAITGVGETDNGSWAMLAMRGGSLVNRGSLVNNGSLDLSDTDYTQASPGKLVTYNSSGLDIRGGSITVPSGGEFLNEGYLRITDQYGADYNPCDLSGFEDFFTTWNQKQNDSHWCDYAAQVFDLAGMKAAEAEQLRRIAAFEDDSVSCDNRYNRMDICGDITLTEDLTLGSFRDYWLQNHEEERWYRWDEALQDWVEAEAGAEGAHLGYTAVGTVLTVPEGVTLTVARDNALRVNGMEDRMEFFVPNKLDVRGTLVIQSEQEEDWEQGIPHIDHGLVEIWSYGSFACTGTVENDGVFEVRYHEGGVFDEENWEMVYDGSIFRPEDCPVTGAPDNAVSAFEARTLAGLKTAALSSDPPFHRVYIREDCAITVTENVSMLMDMNIEPGSGLIVEHGAALTLGGHLWNDGDITVEGVLRVNSLDNNQSITLGSAGSNEAARLEVNGELNNQPGAWLRAYNSASALTVGSTSVDVSSGYDDGFNLRTWDEFNGELGRNWSVLQIDADAGETPVKLCGVMPAYNELRIMQGSVDITELDASAVEVISISDMWAPTRVALGSNPAELRSHNDGEYMQWGCGIEIVEAKNAVIRVLGSDLAFAGPSGNDYVSTWVSVNGYRIDPHIFGVREYTEEPCVYIGIDDDSVLYDLYVDSQWMYHEDEYHVDGEEKTHLSKKAGEAWFAAGPDDDPGLAMTILLPEGVTVDVEHVPVKPEWEEPQS
ncbi:MAG: S-layer homology domain-containing protein [Oscillospiraceae bacterium]|nr:S-layer homology domain-containing protein [Oscillospiraceae bacterium]